MTVRRPRLPLKARLTLAFAAGTLHAQMPNACFEIPDDHPVRPAPDGKIEIFQPAGEWQAFIEAHLFSNLSPHEDVASGDGFSGHDPRLP